MEYDKEYVQELQRQAENLAHHIQMVTDEENSDLINGICKMNADECVRGYFRFKQAYSND